MEDEDRSLLEAIENAMGMAWDMEVHFISILKDLKEEVDPELQDKVQELIEISEGRKRNYLRYKEIIRKVLEE
jgi:hypothetical protein